jgi:hypothetical protein
MGKVRACYTAHFKLQVLRYAQEHGNRAAGRKFRVDETNVRRWSGEKQKLEGISKKKCAFRGKKCKYPRLEAELYQYVMNTRKNGFAVSMEMLQFEGCKLARKHNISVSEFKVSYGWVRRFMARHDLTIRHRTTIAHTLLEAFEEKLASFQKCVQKLRMQHEYLLGQIGNANQTPVFFDMPESTTVNSASEQTTEAEKESFTVMLAITADGQKLPPYVVFKRKMMEKEKFPQGIIVRVQECGWMTEDLVDWIKSVWFQRPGALLCQQSMLVLDSFHGQTTENVKAQLQQQKCDLVTIPEGMTGILQPLDVINRPFKGHIQHSYSEWAQETQKTTPTGCLKRATLTEMCQWILEAWQSISQDMIVKSFKVTGISNKMDGSEDNFLWRRSDKETCQEDATDSEED